jgi:hypothetical protein
LKTKITKQLVNYQVGAFADDVDILCKNNSSCIQAVFNQYEQLFNRSGLELNADKTEILSLGSATRINYNVSYLNSNFLIATIQKVKICGLWYCNDSSEEYKLNVSEKIIKMECMLKKWRSRNLTFEGKSLIIKTFGLSQLVYVLQVVHIDDECIKKLERIMYGFIWLGTKSDKERGIDRIKRSVLKNT